MDELSDELRLTKAELEEKRTLNEKLELDLLQLEMHKPQSNGLKSTSSTDTLQDTLGLPDLGLGNAKSTTVGVSITCFYKSRFNCSDVRILLVQPLFLLRHLQIPQFFLLSLVNAIDSVSGTQS